MPEVSEVRYWVQTTYTKVIRFTLLKLFPRHVFFGRFFQILTRHCPCVTQLYRFARHLAYVLESVSE